MATFLKVVIILITAPLLCNSVCWCTDQTHYAGEFICAPLNQRDCGRKAASHKCQWGASKPKAGVRILDEAGLDKALLATYKKFATYKTEILSTDYKNKLRLNTLDIAAEMKKATDQATDLMHHIWNKYIIDNPPKVKFPGITFYLLGTGSFGRGEMLPSSDLDILPIAIGLSFLKSAKDKLEQIKITLGSAPKIAEYEKVIVDLFEMKFSDLTVAYKDITKESQQKELQTKEKRDIYNAIKGKCKTMDIHLYLQHGITWLKEEVNFLRHGTFAADAFGVDNNIKEIVKNDVDQLIHHISKFEATEKKITWRAGGNQSPISIFGDSFVLHEEGPATGGFKAMHEKFIKDVPIKNLEMMWKNDIANNFVDAKLAQSQLTDATIGTYVPDEYKPKYLYIRAYSLLPYWAYLVFLKSGIYDKHDFIYSTPQRIKKFVSWGLLDGKLGDMVIEQFYIQQRWTLVANLAKDTTLRGNPKVYWHGRGFTAKSTLTSSGVKVRRRQVVSKNAVTTFASFGQQMKDIFGEAVDALSKHKKPASPIIEVLPELAPKVKKIVLDPEQKDTVDETILTKVAIARYEGFGNELSYYDNYYDNDKYANSQFDHYYGQTKSVSGNSYGIMIFGMVMFSVVMCMICVVVGCILGGVAGYFVAIWGQKVIKKSGNVDNVIDNDFAMNHI